MPGQAQLLRGLHNAAHEEQAGDGQRGAVRGGAGDMRGGCLNEMRVAAGIEAAAGSKWRVAAATADAEGAEELVGVHVRRAAATAAVVSGSSARQHYRSGPVIT